MRGGVNIKVSSRGGYIPPEGPNLRNCLGLGGLLCVVGRNAFSLEPLGFGIFLLVIAEEIDIFLLFRWCSCSCRRNRRNESLSRGARAGQTCMLSSIRSDVSVPSRYVRERRRFGLRDNRLEYVYVSLGRSISANDV
jgi:hypothetical protein